MLIVSELEQAIFAFIYIWAFLGQFVLIFLVVDKQPQTALEFAKLLIPCTGVLGIIMLCFVQVLWLLVEAGKWIRGKISND